MNDMFDLSKLQESLVKQPRYRLTQARQAIFGDLISDWNQASNLPADLRLKLNQDCPLNIESSLVQGLGAQVSKALIVLDDKLSVETVLMRHRSGRNTVCVSSQVGCPLACSFCATGQNGFKRNLTASEIVAQVLYFARLIKNKRISNVVFMGMGEPLLNLDAVWSAVEIINNDLGIAARHISISTAGLVDQIKVLASKPLQINLAISLHAPDDKLRSRLMPINDSVGIKSLLLAVDKYISKTNRQVMFEYLLIKGVNDSPTQAKQLAKLMAKSLYLVNLLAYNATGTFQPSSRATTLAFKGVLESAGVKVTTRHSFGADITAACGQLAGVDSLK